MWLATYRGLVQDKATRRIPANCDALAEGVGLNWVGHTQAMESVHSCDITVFIIVLINAAQIQAPYVLILVICKSKHMLAFVNAIYCVSLNVRNICNTVSGKLPCFGAQSR